MNGGGIQSNTAGDTANSKGRGGGVCIADGGQFTMSNGEIRGNTATSGILSADSGRGGGVFVDGSTSAFTMTGGEIAGNIASTNAGAASGGGYGAGVCIDGGTFQKTGATSGIIHGSDAIEANRNKNIKRDLSVETTHGQAVYAGSKKRETTAGTSIELNSETSGGWE
jgi:hypothetical protein